MDKFKMVKNISQRKHRIAYYKLFLVVGMLILTSILFLPSVSATVAWNISAVTYNGVNISTDKNQEVIKPADLFFKPDGTKMYEIGFNADLIYQSTCTDAWNISSCSYAGVNISTQDVSSQGLFFKPDGTKMYEIGYNQDLIYQYNCSDAWNLSSCSYENINISTQSGDARDLFFKPDGTKLYETGGAENLFYQSTCTDAWNISSCSYDNVNISEQDIYASDLFFKPDGTKMYEIGFDKDKIYQYNCSDAWNLSSCSYENINISTQDASSEGLFIKSDGTRMYEIGNDKDIIYQSDFPVVTYNLSYNNQTIEESLETFLINVTMVEYISLVTATLNYDNTNYLGTSTDLGDGNYEVSRSLTIPVVSSDVNKTFYWSLLFENGYIENTTSYNQTVLNFGIDNCSTHTNLIYNFTLVDEENQDSLLANNSIEILANVYNTDRSILVSNYSGSVNISSIGICISRNLSNFASTYLFDSTVKYSAQDYETEYYNIEGYSLTNQSEVQNITLYDLLTSDSTEFQLTFTGSNFLAVENALIFVKRQYVSENLFKTVELPKTDSNGQTILHLVRNDVVYNIEVMKEGVVIGNFENIIAFCDDVVIGDCKIVLSAAESGEAIFDYDDDLGITYTGPTYNNVTRIITFSFLTTDGSVKTVLMNATRNDIFGNISICSASIVSSGATLTCEVPSYIEDSTIITKIFVNGIETLKDYTVLSEFNYGKAGYFIFFVYMLAFILMFSKDKTTMLIGIVVGFIVGISLGLISGKLVGVGASGVWLIIVIILMIWKLNKERPN